MQILKKISIMKKLVLLVAALALAACAGEKTPEQKVVDLLNARFDSLAVHCRAVSVEFKDTLRTKLTTADPGYRALYDKWVALMEARVSLGAPEYIEARGAMAEYEAAWVGEPVALLYSCTVETEDALLKAMVESGEFAISLDHSAILEHQSK